MVLTLAALLLSGCKSRAVEEAQEVIAVADSLRAEGQGYTDSVVIAEAYNTLEKWQYIYPTDYARACYYYGRLLRAKDDPVSAMEVFINGTHSRTKDYHILGRIYSNMGSISHLAGEYQLAYDMYSRSADMFLKNADTLLYYYGLNNMAVECAAQGKKDETLYIINQVFKGCNDINVKIIALEAKAEMYLQTQQYDSAIYYAKQLSLRQNDEPTGLIICAQAFSLSEQHDSATFYANRAIEKSTSAYNIYNLLYIFTNDDNSKDLDAVRKVAAERADLQQVLKLQQGDLSQAAQLLEQDLNRKWEWRGWFILVVIIISLISIIVISQKRRMQHQMMRNISDKHSRITIESIKTHIDTSDLEQTLHWKKYASMKIEADLYMSGIVSNLEARHLNETEIRYCVLTLLDFKPKDIADILFYSYPSGIKTLKKRIANKLGTEPQKLKDFLFHLPYKM